VRETRLDLLLHLTCNGAFLLCLWSALSRGKTVWLRSVVVLTAGWLLYARLSAAASPILGAASEEWFHRLDAALLFLVALWSLAQAPEFFLATLTGVAILAGLAGALGWEGSGATATPQTILAVCVALTGAATLILLGLGRKDHSAAAPRTVPRIGPARFGWLAVGTALLLTAEWGLLERPRTGPAFSAAAEIARLRPLEGCGLGGLPETLEAFAPGDYSALPFPSDGLLALRAESGWLGVALLALLAAAAFLTGPRVFSRWGLDRRSLLWLGLAAMLLTVLVAGWRQPVLLAPFGRLMFFLLVGLIAGTAGSRASGHIGQSAPQVPGRARRQFAAALVAPVALAIVAVAAAESRPYRAARMARRQGGEVRYAPSWGQRLEKAARVNPREASQWEALVVYRRAVMDRKPFSEALYQDTVAAYEKAIAADPYRFRTHVSLAVFHHLAARPEQMVEALRRGLDFLPHCETLRRFLIKARLENQEYTEAVEELKLLSWSLSGAPSSGRPGDPRPAGGDSIAAHLRLAEFYEMLGRPARALDQYALAFSKAPYGPQRDEVLSGMARLKAKILAQPSIIKGEE
jgi:tetratricopeptide (TPR) repeat protein